MRNGGGGAAGVGRQRDLREPVGDRYADLGIGGVQVRLRNPHVRTLPHEIRRHAQRQPLRQPERLQLESRSDLFAREVSGEKGDEVALLGKLLLQRRQQELCLRDRGFLRDHVRQRDLPVVVASSQNTEQFRLQRNEPSGGGDLAAQRRLLDSGKRDIGGQGQIDAFALERLNFDQCVRRLNQPPSAAKNVGHVVYGHLRGMQAVGTGA